METKQNNCGEIVKTDGSQTKLIECDATTQTPLLNEWDARIWNGYIVSLCPKHKDVELRRGL